MSTEETITLAGEKSSIEISSNTLLVAIDETGHEKFAPTHRVFGLGGCACLVKHYGELIDNPWRGLKEELFGGANMPLHAAKLRSPNTEQLNALNFFFTNFQFFRFAVMAAEDLDNSTEFQLIKLVCRSLLDRIAEIAGYCYPEGVAIIAEHSQRIGEDLMFELSGYRMTDGDIDFSPMTCLLPKSANWPMLEVADFVMHAAGAQMRNRISGKFNIRKDFDSVFYQVDRRLSFHVQLLSVKNMAQP